MISLVRSTNFTTLNTLVTGRTDLFQPLNASNSSTQSSKASLKACCLRGISLSWESALVILPRACSRESLT